MSKFGNSQKVAADIRIGKTSEKELDEIAEELYRQITGGTNMTKLHSACKAVLSVGDDYGDNISTFHCQLPEGHDGQHREDWSTGKKSSVSCTILWGRASHSTAGQSDAEQQER